MPALLLFLAFAQGLTDDAILIGMEGHAGSFSVDEENRGMRLLIEQVNEAGGIHGRKLVEASYPRDGNNPIEQQVANVKQLVEEDNVFLLFNFGGPGSVAIGDYAMKNDVPYLFPHTALLKVDGDRHIYTSYPRYAGESKMMLRYLANDRNAQRIAVIHAPNVYGDYFVERASELADEIGYTFVGNQPLGRNATNAISQMTALQNLQPDAVIMALYPEGAKRAVQAKAALEWDVQLVSSGPLTDEQYLNIEGGHAEGTLGFCHFPDPDESDAAGIAEYRRLMRKHFPEHETNRYSLYGYVFGRLVVEGLQRAGPDLTRDSFLDAMESIKNWDSEGILPKVSFSAANHHAQRAGIICELENGRFMGLTGWVTP